MINPAQGFAPSLFVPSEPALVDVNPYSTANALPSVLRENSLDGIARPEFIYPEKRSLESRRGPLPQEKEEHT